MDHSIDTLLRLIEDGNWDSVKQLMSEVCANPNPISSSIKEIMFYNSIKLSYGVVNFELSIEGFISCISRSMEIYELSIDETEELITNIAKFASIYKNKNYEIVLPEGSIAELLGVSRVPVSVSYKLFRIFYEECYEELSRVVSLRDEDNFTMLDYAVMHVLRWSNSALVPDELVNKYMDIIDLLIECCYTDLNADSYILYWSGKNYKLIDDPLYKEIKSRIEFSNGTHVKPAK